MRIVGKIALFVLWFALMSQQRLTELMIGLAMIATAIALNKRRAMRVQLALVGGAVGGGNYAGWGLFFLFLPLGLIIFGGIFSVIGAMHVIGVHGGEFEWFAPTTQGITAETAPTESGQVGDARPAPIASARSGENDGSDPLRPMLPKSDNGFADSRGGWGWSDKCWSHIKAAKWGWAKAECDEGIKLGPASPQPRASLLYNEGVIAKAAGDLPAAKAAFAESLSLRENTEVRAALADLEK